MSLPKLETPTYFLELPSSGEKIKFRPFLVKEYKILLTSLETDNEETYRVINELIDACTFNKLDMDKLSNFDIEYIFLNLRSKSVGEIANLNMKCDKCETMMDVQMDLTKAEIEKIPEHTNKILISDTIGIEMRYPKFNEMLDIYQNFNSDKIIELMAGCIKNVYTEDQVYEEYTKQELDEFINSLSKEQFEKIEKFFVSMPKVVQKIEKDCPSCGTTNSIKLEGLQNFFV
jgi:phage FluMu protein Com